MSGIFLEHNFKYQDAHENKMGGAILGKCVCVGGGGGFSLFYVYSRIHPVRECPYEKLSVPLLILMG